MGKLGAFAVGLVGSLMGSLAWADEAIDLTELGAGGYRPFPGEADRNALWIVLPLAILFLVCLHLRKGRKLGPPLPPLPSNGPEKVGTRDDK